MFISQSDFLRSLYQMYSLFSETRFVFELQGKNREGYYHLVIISNKYTTVSNEDGTFSFFCYDLNSSMYKNKLTL